MFYIFVRRWVRAVFSNLSAIPVCLLLSTPEPSGVQDPAHFISLKSEVFYCSKHVLGLGSTHLLFGW